MEVYLKALRDGYFVPWIKGTRLIDVSNFGVAVAKVALRNILNSIEGGKLSLFDLNIIVSSNSSENESQDDEFEKRIDEFFINQDPNGVLKPIRIIENNDIILKITREALAVWMQYLV